MSVMDDWSECTHNKECVHRHQPDRGKFGWINTQIVLDNWCCVEAVQGHHHSVIIARLVLQVAQCLGT